MKDYEIERRLRAAAEEETPDVLDNVLRELGKERTMEATLRNDFVEVIPVKNGKAGRVWKQMGAMAAAVALVFGAGTAYANYTVDSVVGIDVNPSLELRINRNEKVLSATALNKDAEVVLEGMDLKRVDLDVAVNAIIGSMVKNGYLDGTDNAINVCVENDNSERGEKLSQKLTQEINGLLADSSVGGKVMAQTQSENKQTAQLAKEYNVSQGKAALAEQAVEASNGTISAEEAVRMSVKDLWAVVYPVVAPEDAIGAEQALTAACEDAGVEQADVTLKKCELLEDDGVWEYEIEFRVGKDEYEYEIDAQTGAIRSKDVELYQVPAEETPKQLTHEKALAAAYKDAGVKKADVTLEKCELSEDDGVWEYEIEFRVGKDGYEYEIDAQTGAIRSKDVELYQEPEKEEPKQLTQEKVLAAAYKDAGVKKADVTLEKCELLEDDGVWEYEIEFRVGKDEYKYEIDAQTGAIRSKDVELYQEPEKEESKQLTQEKALAVAYKDAGVKKADVTLEKCELSEDDGVWEYEIEFRVGKDEYEYEIDAQTGAIRSKDVELYQEPEKEEPKQLTQEKALAVAYKDAGVKKADVTLEKCELSEDDGVWVYEIEFQVGEDEYDYEIDAQSGEILGREIDVNNRDDQGGDKDDDDGDSDDDDDNDDNDDDD